MEQETRLQLNSAPFIDGHFQSLSMLEVQQSNEKVPVPMEEELEGQNLTFDGKDIGELSSDQKNSKSKSHSTADAEGKDQEEKATRRAGRPMKLVTQEKPMLLEKLVSSNATKKQYSEDRHKKSRKEPMNYDEMVACANLLRYMDWDKVDPKSHQNLPCRGCLL